MLLCAVPSQMTGMPKVKGTPPFYMRRGAQGVLMVEEMGRVVRRSP